MTRHFASAVLLGVAAFCNLAAQQIVVSVEWERMSGESACSFRAVRQTKDGGYILGGHLYDVAVRLPPGDSSAKLVKLDSAGEVEWEKQYGGPGAGSIASVDQTSDGGFVFLASFSSPRPDQQERQLTHLDAWVVKVDGAGNKQWEGLFGGSENEYVVSLLQTTDGGYLLAGHSSSSVSGNKEAPLRGSGDGWVVKLDAQGNKQWDKSFGGEQSDGFTSVQQTSDGRYVLAGWSHSPFSSRKTSTHFGKGDGWAVKINLQGRTLWERSFGGSEGDGFHSIDKTADGGVILGGASTSPPSGNKESPLFGEVDYWLVKLDGAGNKEWDRSYGTRPVYTGVDVVRQTSDRGYAFGGGGRMIKVDAQGRQQWQHLFGDTEHDLHPVRDLQQTSDGGYILCGRYENPYANIPFSGCEFSSWVIKLEPVPAVAGEVVTWHADADMVLESANNLKDVWTKDQSPTMRVGGVSAVALAYSGQQRYYRLRSTGNGGSAPKLSIGALVTWPAETQQRLEFSNGQDGPWEAFPGEQQLIGTTNYAIIPPEMKTNSFRARKNLVKGQ